MYIIIITLLLVAFPTNQNKTLKKGERWDIGCMDIDITVVETTVRVGESWIPDRKKATVICNNMENKPKAYFSCPNNSDPDAEPPEVLCR
jgi:hypothetical protein